MEKRWCERVPVSISVVILHHGNKIGRCKVKDISLRGICLNSGPLSFHENTELMIKFPDAGYLSGNVDNINAIVVRNAPKEISLVFDPVVPEMIRAVIRCARDDNGRRFVAPLQLAT